MHVGLLAPPWYPIPPPAYGGTEEVVHMLATGLVDAHVEVTVFAIGGSTVAGVVRSLYDVPPRPIGLGIAEAAHALAGYEALADADVVHDHTVLGAMVAPRRAGIVVTHHGPFGRDEASLFRRIADRAAVVAISESQAACGRARGVDVRRVIHHGVDTHRIPVGSGSGGHLMFLGRMAPEKGAAVAISVARGAGLPLVIAGKCAEPREREYFEAAIRPHLGPDVEYVGEVGRDDKHHLLGRSVALVNPISWAEPFGLVMAESLACGTPVLTTHHGAAPEIVEEGVTGFLRDDAAGMVDAVGRLAGIDRAACRAAALARFSREAMVQRHLELYEEVLTNV